VAPLPTTQALEAQLLQNVGKVIARLRKERPGGRMTQTELAQAAGITQAYLSEIESGKAAVTLPVLLRICDALGTSLAEVTLQAELEGRDLTGMQRGAVQFLCGLLEDLYRSPRP
jgi:transcriptional regulator with XRE-family HTH domain